MKLLLALMIICCVIAINGISISIGPKHLAEPEKHDPLELEHYLTLTQGDLPSVGQCKIFGARGIYIKDINIDGDREFFQFNDTPLGLKLCMWRMYPVEFGPPMRVFRCDGSDQTREIQRFIDTGGGFLMGGVCVTYALSNPSTKPPMTIITSQYSCYERRACESQWDTVGHPGLNDCNILPDGSYAGSCTQDEVRSVKGFRYYRSGDAAASAKLKQEKKP